jgi:hypothetical protein
MTKSEAIEAIEEGKKITHQWFSDDEFVKMSDEEGVYEFEDGVKQLKEEFWKLRTDLSWLIDWEIKE